MGFASLNPSYEGSTNPTWRDREPHQRNGCRQLCWLGNDGRHRMDEEPSAIGALLFPSQEFLEQPLTLDLGPIARLG